MASLQSMVGISRVFFDALVQDITKHDQWPWHLSTLAMFASTSKEWYHRTRRLKFISCLERASANIIFSGIAQFRCAFEEGILQASDLYRAIAAYNIRAVSLILYSLPGLRKQMGIDVHPEFINHVREVCTKRHSELEKASVKIAAEIELAKFGLIRNGDVLKLEDGLDVKNRIKDLAEELDDVTQCATKLGLDAMEIGSICDGSNLLSSFQSHRMFHETNTNVAKWLMESSKPIADELVDGKGHVLCSLGQVTERELLKHDLSRHADEGHQDAAWWLGKFEESNNDNYEAAELWYRRGIDQGNLDAHLSMGNMYKRRGRFLEALHHYQLGFDAPHGGHTWKKQIDDLFEEQGTVDLCDEAARTLPQFKQPFLLRCFGLCYERFCCNDKALFWYKRYCAEEVNEFDRFEVQAIVSALEQRMHTGRLRLLEHSEDINEDDHHKRVRRDGALSMSSI